METQGDHWLEKKINIFQKLNLQQPKLTQLSD